MGKNKNLFKRSFATEDIIKIVLIAILLMLSLVIVGKYFGVLDKNTKTMVNTTTSTAEELANAAKDTINGVE